MQYNSVPLTFNSFQFLKEIPEYVQKDKHLENQEIALEPIQQSFQFIQDPIVDVLDDLCCQSHVSFANYGLKRIYDLDMIRQLVSWFVSAGASFQSRSENMQLNQKLYDDTDNICEISSHNLKLAEFEYQGIGHVYHDPITIHMEAFFTSEFKSNSSTSYVFHSSNALCYEDQIENRFIVPLQALVMMFIKNNEGVQLLNQLLDWLHWHFFIT
jgi:hypothetical protein